MTNLTGRELDAKVHEAVFNQKTEMRECYWFTDDHCWSEVESNTKLYQNFKSYSTPHPCYKDDNWDWVVVPLYSTDIKSAWKLVDKFAVPDHFSLALTEQGWHCQFRCENSLNVIGGVGETPALAISRAALLTAS